MAICAYCGLTLKSTKEHILPAALLELFPEAPFSIRGDTWFKADLVIKDVCPKCNNEVLGNLDAYGVDLVRKYFVADYENDSRLMFEYDYTLLLRWLLKIMYNDERSNKRDVSWFKDHLDYICGYTLKGFERVSLFGGLFVDPTPFSKEVFGVIPLELCPDPALLINGILRNVIEKDNEDAEPKEKSIEFDHLIRRFLIRLGSGLFLMFLWDDQIDLADIEQNELYVQQLFPYSILKTDGVALLRRSTDPFNIRRIALVNGYPGQSYADYVYSVMSKDFKI